MKSVFAGQRVIDSKHPAIVLVAISDHDPIAKTVRVRRPGGSTYLAFIGVLSPADDAVLPKVVCASLRGSDASAAKSRQQPSLPRLRCLEESL